MPFTEFITSDQVQQRYNIVAEDKSFVEARPIEPSPEFLINYQFAIEHLAITTSEASKREVIIFPILLDVFRRHVERLALFSHKSMGVDTTLSGTPDYLISKRSKLGKSVLENPLLVVVEAKRDDFELGWRKCGNYK